MSGNGEWRTSKLSQGKTKPQGREMSKVSEIFKERYVGLQVSRWVKVKSTLDRIGLVEGYDRYIAASNLSVEEKYDSSSLHRGFS